MVSRTHLIPPKTPRHCGLASKAGKLSGTIGINRSAHPPSSQGSKGLDDSKQPRDEVEVIMIWATQIRRTKAAAPLAMAESRSFVAYRSKYSRPTRSPIPRPRTSWAHVTAHATISSPPYVCSKSNVMLQHMVPPLIKHLSSIPWIRNFSN
ncbi:hypothetical protein HYQ46_011022 [Verticillium longisporum]|nr:hypothetical protein HYQ46_011022 [Verticillium longisporum]KAG7120431.1 hypothetical protein HYQ44_004927 [Verticillium longisporum]